MTDSVAKNVSQHDRALLSHRADQYLRALVFNYPVAVSISYSGPFFGYAGSDVAGPGGHGKHRKTTHLNLKPPSES